MRKIKILLVSLINFIKSKTKIANVLSVLAVLISLINMYFQFFNIKHELLYTFLFPSINEKLEIPMIYKNTGNQNEIILESNIELEIKPDDDTENYFRRIGDENKKSFPLIIAPGDYKTITLLGDYKDYFKGMLEKSSSGLKYRKIVNLDSLTVLLTTKFISKNGVSQDKRIIGKLSFKKDHEFDRFDYLPVKLIALESESDGEMLAGSLINANYSMHINGSDKLTQDQIEQIKFMINIVEDTIIKKEMMKLIGQKD